MQAMLNRFRADFDFKAAAVRGDKNNRAYPLNDTGSRSGFVEVRQEYWKICKRQLVVLKAQLTRGQAGVDPALSEKTGMKVGRFLSAYSPERVDPNNKEIGREDP